MQRLTDFHHISAYAIAAVILAITGICLSQPAEVAFAQETATTNPPNQAAKTDEKNFADAIQSHPAVEPHVFSSSDEGQRAIATFRVPEGMKVELFAAEPEVANPVSFCFDEQGRCFVAETYRQNKGVEDNRSHMNWLDDDLASHTVDDRLAMFKKFLGKEISKYADQTDRIRMLLDTRGTGRADKSTIVADGFNGILDGTGAGLLAHHGDLYYTCIPNLWKISGISENAPAEHREILHTGYGVRVAFRGHDMHGLIIGPDGKLYYSIGDRGFHVKVGDRVLENVESGSVLRCNLDGSGLEIFATGLRNPQELAFDDYGNLFTCDNNSDSGDKARWEYIVEGGDSGWRMAYQYLADRGPFNREKIWYPPFAGQAAYIVPPVANVADGPSGLVYDPGVGLPEKYRGSFFLVDFRGGAGSSGVHAIRVKPKGAGFELASDEKFFWSILATDVDIGPDSKMYVSDWVEGWDGCGKGRIYRLFDPQANADPKVEEVKRLIAGDWSQVNALDLLDMLGHVDRRIRQQAQFELVKRGSARALAVAAINDTRQLARIHALWGIGQIGMRWYEQEVVLSLLKLFDDPDAEIRAQTAKLMGGFKSLSVVDDKLIVALADESPRVKFFAALELGKRKPPAAVDALVKMLTQNNDADPVLRFAGIAGLAGCANPEALAAMATHPPRAVRLAAVVALRRLNSPLVGKFLADSDPKIVLEAARAIHDVPIIEAFPALAAVVDHPVLAAGDDGDALFRRVLSANFHLGGVDHANALAKFAASEQPIPDSLRIEALEMLGSWSHPSGRDRVLGMWRPIEPREAAAAADALRPVLSQLFASSNTVRKSAAQVAGQSGIIEAAPELVKIVGDRSRESSLRVEALRMLDVLGEKNLWEITDAALTDADPQVRIEARQLLVKQRTGKALKELQQALEHGEPAERQAALLQLDELKLPEADQVLESAMQQLLAGKMPPAMQLDLLEAAAARNTPKLREQLKQFESQRAKDDPLAEYREAMVGGSIARGDKLFHESNELSCRRCHKTGDSGGEVGPNLTSIAAKLAAQFAVPSADGKSAVGNHDEKLDSRIREYLLESIVLPSKTIAKGFETVIVVTDDGRQFSGVFQSEDEVQLRLVTPEGKPIVVPKRTIEERRTGPSAMPADLVKHMTKRQLRDLVEYLASLRGEP